MSEHYNADTTDDVNQHTKNVDAYIKEITNNATSPALTRSVLIEVLRDFYSLTNDAETSTLNVMRQHNISDELRRVMSDAANQIEAFLDASSYKCHKYVWRDNDMYTWYLYDGVMWNTISNIITHFQTKERDPDTRVEKHVKYIFRNNHKILYDVVKKIHELSGEPVQFNAPHLLAFNNGVYVLNTKQFRTIEKTDYITKTTGYVYEPCALPNDELDEFVSTVFTDANTRENFYEMVSNIVNMRDARLCMFKGSGGNGKTTVLRLVKLLLGNYAESIPSTYLTYEKGTPPVSMYDRSSLYESKPVMFHGYKLVTTCHEDDNNAIYASNINFFTDDGMHILFDTCVGVEINRNPHNNVNTLLFTSTFTSDPTNENEFKRKFYSTDKMNEFRNALLTRVLTR